MKLAPSIFLACAAGAVIGAAVPIFTIVGLDWDKDDTPVTSGIAPPLVVSRGVIAEIGATRKQYGFAYAPVLVTKIEMSGQLVCGFYDAASGVLLASAREVVSDDDRVGDLKFFYLPENAKGRVRCRFEPLL